MESSKKCRDCGNPIVANAKAHNQKYCKQCSPWMKNTRKGFWKYPKKGEIPKNGEEVVMVINGKAILEPWLKNLERYNCVERWMRLPEVEND